MMPYANNLAEIIRRFQIGNQANQSWGPMNNPGPFWQSPWHGDPMVNPGKIGPDWQSPWHGDPMANPGNIGPYWKPPQNGDPNQMQPWHGGDLTLGPSQVPQQPPGNIGPAWMPQNPLGDPTMRTRTWDTNNMLPQSNRMGRMASAYPQYQNALAMRAMQQPMGMYQ